MKAIWKFPLEVQDIQTLQMPQGAKILCVQVQNEIPCVWALVDIDKVVFPVTFLTVSTGRPIKDFTGHKEIYVGTYQLRGGQMVFHLFIKAI